MNPKREKGELPVARAHHGVENKVFLEYEFILTNSVSPPKPQSYRSCKALN